MNRDAESNEKPAHARLMDTITSLNLLANAIRSDKFNLDKISSPLQLMKFRAENAESSLIASETALHALTVLHANSLKIIEASTIAMESTRAAEISKDADLKLKQTTLHELEVIIEANKVNLEASAAALLAATELAFNDDLTGLPNRHLLKDRLKQSISNNKRWGTHGAAIYLDLDKFKHINDEFGHDAGDKLLIALSNRLKISVRETDTVARYGGDEFVVLLQGLAATKPEAQAEARAVAAKIISALNAPFSLSIHSPDLAYRKLEYQNHASLGVVVFDGDQSKENYILEWADEAMYWAKRNGGGQFSFYDEVVSAEMTLTHLYSMATENDIETANHGIRMRQYVKALAIRANQMNLFPNELNDQIIERMFSTTQLHDLGKVRIPYSIIHKAGTLDAAEWEIIKTHTTLGAEILIHEKKLNAILSTFLDTAIDMAGGHHEHWDGKGYPKGLAGADIPLAARILAIADVYDALTCKRSYKQPWKHEDAMAEITSKAGSQFDPLLIGALTRESENFRKIADLSRD